MRIENSSALTVTRKRENWLSGHKRLSTWAVLRCVRKDLAKTEILLRSEEFLESVRSPRGWVGRAPKRNFRRRES